MPEESAAAKVFAFGAAPGEFVIRPGIISSDEWDILQNLRRDPGIDIANSIFGQHELIPVVDERGKVIKYVEKRERGLLSGFINSLGGLTDEGAGPTNPCLDLLSYLFAPAVSYIGAQASEWMEEADVLSAAKQARDIKAFLSPIQIKLPERERREGGGAPSQPSRPTAPAAPSAPGMPPYGVGGMPGYVSEGALLLLMDRISRHIRDAVGIGSAYTLRGFEEAETLAQILANYAQTLRD